MPANAQMGTVAYSHQPLNQTQTGIPFQQIRQDLANIIASNANNDIASLQMFNDGQYNSWVNGFIDKLVGKVQQHVDFDAMTNPQVPLPQLYQKALNDVYQFSWANMVARYPTFKNDPSILPKMHIVQNLLGQMSQRDYQLQQAGMTMNNPIQQAPAYAVSNGYNNGYPQYGQYNQYGQPFARKPHTPQQLSGGLSSHHLQNTFQQAKPTNGLHENLAGETDSVYSKMIQNGLPQSRVNPVGQAVSQTPEGKPQFNTAPGVRVPEQPSNVWQNHLQNNVNNTSRLNDDTTVGFEQPKLTPNENMMNTMQSTGIQSTVGDVHFATQPNNSTNTISNTLAQAHEKIMNDVDRLGLLEDEVRYLKLDEVDQLYKEGKHFEQYLAPLSGDPARVAIHAVLAKDDTVRQYITPLDEEYTQMERPVHFDILNSYRQDPRIRYNPTFGKEFTLTSEGGVVYDRFAVAKVQLQEDFNKIEEKVKAEELDLEDQFARGRGALLRFIANIEKDRQRDNQGITKYKETHKDEDGNPIEPTEKELPLSTRVANEKYAKTIVRRRQRKQVVFDVPVTYALTELKNDDVRSSEPVQDDIFINEIIENEETLMITDNVDKIDKIRDHLEVVTVYDEVSEDDAEKAVGLYDIVETFKRHRDTIPVPVATRLIATGTETFNKALKYCLGVDVSIDSIITDYDDLRDWFSGKKFEQLYNREIALGIVDELTALAMMTIAEKPGTEVLVQGTSIDLMKLRAITRVTRDQLAILPSTTISYGLRVRKDSVIDPDSHPQLFKIAYDMFTRQLSSRHKRNADDIEEYGPITNNYIIFEGNERYRVWPRFVGEAVTVPDDESELSVVTSFYFERLSDI